MNRFPPPSKCNCFVLRHAARKLTQIYDHHLTDAGMTANQFTIIGKVASVTTATMGGVSEELVMDRTTLLRALKPLRREMLITIDTPGTDRRKHLLRLTERGQRLFNAACNGWCTAHAEFEDKYGAARATALRNELFFLTGQKDHHESSKSHRVVHIHNNVTRVSLSSDNCFAVRQAARFVSQMYDRGLVDANLTIDQYSILSRVHDANEITMRQLAEVTGADRTTLVRGLQPLRIKGYLANAHVSRPREPQLFTLTAAGRTKFRSAREYWLRTQEAFEHQFGRSWAAMLREELYAVAIA
ncbi:MarR family winged helix-turn-helix transcriptional regulator [Paraburkholderia caribensis]|uniref:MarR family winged helix-turn-helix transcriptional regulator n=1 Tax=Paraburkholderia caribensis TaxID=75105 RepID=UPI0034D15398